MIREVAPKVYVETDLHGANVGFIVTGEGVILIDTPTLPDDARFWRAEIEKRTGQAIIYIINTDHHRGHILGNQYFPSATVIAHEFAWKNMKSYGTSFRSLSWPKNRVRRKNRESARIAVLAENQHPFAIQPGMLSNLSATVALPSRRHRHCDKSRRHRRPVPEKNGARACTPTTRGSSSRPDNVVPLQAKQETAWRTILHLHELNRCQTEAFC